MMKLAGSLCIFTGCGYAWYLQWRQRRRQRQTRTELLAALRSMAQEIGSRQTPIPRLAEQLASGGGGEVQGCFQVFLLLLRQGTSPAAAWKTAVDSLSLTPAEKTAAAELGKGLSQEETMVVKEINLTIKLLETYRDAAQKQSAETEKRASALWFSAAALLVILLI